jgi:hypothetical protein
MTAESVAPVVTALVDPTCDLNGQVIIAASGSIRAAAAVEFGTVQLPRGTVTPAELAAGLAQSRETTPREFDQAVDGFLSFAADIAAAETVRV